MKNILILLLSMLALNFLSFCTDDVPFDEIAPVPPAEQPDSDGESDIPASSNVYIKVGGQTFSVTLADNATAKAFVEKLPITTDMNELNGNEKYFYLSESLPANASHPGTIQAGDLMLYGSDCVVLFYKTFSSSYSYTRIGRINDSSDLPEAVGTGIVSVTLEK